MAMVVIVELVGVTWALIQVDFGVGDGGVDGDGGDGGVGRGNVGADTG